MNIQINRDELFPIISQVQGILEKKTALPVHSYILLEAEKDNLKVFASGGELSFLGHLPCKIKAKGRMALNGKGFFEILREIPSGQEITVTEENNQKIKIKTETSTFHIFGLNPDDFLVFAPIEAKKFQKIPVMEFLDIVDKTLYCVSLDESRYHLTGVFCEPFTNSSTYRFAATDGHRLAFFDLQLPEKDFVSFKEGVIIPRKGLQEIKRMIGVSGEEGESFEFAVESSRVVVRFKNQTLFIRLIDGVFPNYKALIPKDKGTGVVLNREEFLSALRSVSVLTNERFRAVNFLFKDKILCLEVFVPEVGEGKAIVKCNYTQEKELKIRFNSRYILDVINVLDEDKVQVFVNTSASPGIITGKGNKNYTSVIMPMNLPKAEKKS